MSLGEVLRNLLDEKDVTQKQLADSLNIGASTVGNYMQNIREPDYDVLKNIAIYFDVSIDYLLEHKTKQAASVHEDELLRIFRALSTDQQELFLKQGKLLITYNNEKRKSQGLNTADEKAQ